MNQHIQKQIIKDLKDKIVGKHCRCCDLSKHYYDNELEAFLKTSLERVWEEAQQEIKKELKGELLPILDATHKWLKAHDQADEIFFNKRTDEDGIDRSVPVKAIYNSPIAKFHSIVEAQSSLIKESF